MVRSIPRGKVATYGQVAALAGNPRNARFVGFALHANPDPERIPCHRVVFRDGSLAPGFAFGGPDEQRRRLEQEGVRFIPPIDVPDHASLTHDHASGAHRHHDHEWRVDLIRCQWRA